jgi:F0F1-type ATP synthase assembly protein I
MLMVVAAALAWGVVMGIAGWEFDSLAGAVPFLILIIGLLVGLARATRHSGMERFEHID